MEKNLVPAARFLWRIKSDGALTVFARGCLRIREVDASIEVVVLLSMVLVCLEEVVGEEEAVDGRRKRRGGRERMRKGEREGERGEEKAWRAQRRV
jgi:hypothetical protein